MKIDIRIFAITGAVLALISAGAWAGSVNEKLCNHAKVLEVIPQMASDIAQIKGFLEK